MVTHSRVVATAVSRAWRGKFVLAHWQSARASSPGFMSGISQNDPGALQGHCVILYNFRGEKEILVE